MNVKVNIGGERSPHNDKGQKKERPKNPHIPTKSPRMKKTANEPGDPRIEEEGTWNSH